MNVGCRIRTSFQRPDLSLLNEFRGIPSSNIGDMMNRLFCMDGGIRSFGNFTVLGPAFTVRVPLGDNMFIHRALDLASPGDILIVDASRGTERSVVGEIMFTYAAKKGLGGMIVDGAIRDVDAIAKLNFPVYARGVTPQGPYKNGPGEINFPVVCGGQVVMPGDIIAGDSDGICVIPQADAPYIIKACQDKAAHEHSLLASYHAHGPNYNVHGPNYEKLTESLNTTYV